jgi:hypothetical protein
MGSLRDLRTQRNFEIESFLEKYLGLRDFVLIVRKDFEGWVKLKYQHKQGIVLIINLWSNLYFSISFDSPFHTAIESGQAQDKKQLIESLKNIFSQLDNTSKA